MADFQFVLPRLAIGAAVSREDAPALKAAGITHVIDARIEVNDTDLLTGTGVTVLWDGTQDDGGQKPAEWFKNAVDFSFAAYADPKHKLLFHCAAGVNRGPSLGYTFMRALGFEPIIAVAMIKHVRPQVGLAYKDQGDAFIKGVGYDG